MMNAAVHKTRSIGPSEIINPNKDLFGNEIPESFLNIMDTYGPKATDYLKYLDDDDGKTRNENKHRATCLKNKKKRKKGKKKTK